jgi:hypothetical protein
MNVSSNSDSFVSELAPIWTLLANSPGLNCLSLVG